MQKIGLFCAFFIILGLIYNTTVAVLFWFTVVQIPSIFWFWYGMSAIGYVVFAYIYSIIYIYRFLFRRGKENLTCPT